MLNEYFIKQGIKEAQIEEFIRTNFPLGDYSKTELQRTPLGIKIIIYTNKPGRIIGRGGKNIDAITEAIKRRFDLENPQVDVKTIENPNLDAKIIAKQTSSALEKGYNYKKIGNLTIKRIMDAGAIGAEIIISGKLSGSKGLTSKFTAGYLKHSGMPSKELVDVGFEEAQTRPGKIGVRVKIMKEFQDICGERRRTMEPEPKEEKPAEEKKEEAKPKKKAKPAKRGRSAKKKAKTTKRGGRAKKKSERPREKKKSRSATKKVKKHKSKK